MNLLQPCRGLGSRGHSFARRPIFRPLGVVLCLLAAGLQSLPAATVVNAPYLQNLGADHVTVVWAAKENQAASVQYSTDGSFSKSVAARVVRTFSSSETDIGFTFSQYRADLTGLAPGTAYSYRVIVGGQPFAPVSDTTAYRFSTPGPGPFSFLVYGDSGDGSNRQIAVALQMVKEQPNFVLHVGDIAYQSGTFAEFSSNYFAYYFTLMRRAGFFPVAGNHEYYTQDSAPYLALSVLPDNGVPEDPGRYYSFDWGNVHFVGLDANLLDAPFPLAQARMLAWMENDLATSQAPWKIAFWHQTPYPLEHHLDDPIDTAARNLLVPILERHGVQLVLTGHEHNYTRSKALRAGVPVAQGAAGTVYITTGGGGGELHPVLDTLPAFLEYQASVNHYLRIEVAGPVLTIHSIQVDSVNPNGKEFDHLVITLPRPPVLSGVVNGASFLPSLATGELVSIFGQSLATDSQAPGFPLPLSLGGSTVTLNGTPMAITFSSPAQINAALPLDAVGTSTLRVTNSAGFAEAQVSINDSAPAIFATGITHAGGAAVSAAAPAAPGETLTIYMTGLGQVDGKLAAGQAAPSTPLLHVLAPVLVQIGTAQVSPDFAGLAPGFVGLYQVNVAVPQDLAAKTYPLQVMVKGNLSNSLNIPVQPRNP
uniref:Metallophosphoesterase n=1 Tax=Solibacter usitatus (strain Ellin6076) TaxID=234267 RepID=Q01ZC1_SOLUE